MADVTIVSGSVTQETARAMRLVVFTTDQIGYCFYTSLGIGYRKTTNGGATWGSQQSIGGGSTTPLSLDVWYDGWTPGNSGTTIWITYFEATNDIVFMRALDTNGDVVSAARTVFTGASAVTGRGNFASITRARSGYLYVAFDIDAGAERGLVRSTDGGVVWSANLSTTFVEATLDTCKLFPASGTGDDNDCWALYYDASALALTLKLWDSSAAAQVESATIGVAHTDGATDLTGQFGYDGAVRHSDGHLIVAKQSTRDVAAGTHQVFDITDTSTITTKTAIAASTDDHYYPQITINQNNNDLYVAYNGKRDGSEVLDTTTAVYYTKSTDGGTTWSAGDTAYMEGAAGIVQQVWTPHSGLRFYVVWRVGASLLGNAVNSVSLPAGPAAQAVTGTTLATTAVVTAAHTVDNAIRVVSGTTRASTVTLPTPHVVTPGAVTTTGPTLASTAQLFAGTVAIGSVAQAVTGTTLASGAAVTAGTVAPGAVTTTGATISSGVVVRAGSVTPGAVTTAGATIGSGVIVRAGSVTTTTAVTGATLGSSVVLRAGTVTTTTSVTGATLASTLGVFPGAASTTAAAAVGGATLASGAILRPGVVTAGAVTVLGATRSSSAQVFAGVVSGVAAPVAADQPFMWLM